MDLTNLSSVHLSTWALAPIQLQIRIDAEGNQVYTQFDAQPHPPMKPMAYASNGLASLLM